MKKIALSTLQNPSSYTAYRTLVNHLVAEEQSTGTDQSEERINFSLLNDRRMKRLDKTLQLSPETTAEINAITSPQTWLVLSEGWCGDAAQNLPVIAKMAAVNPKITLQVILRDENLPVMDAFLTNGGRAIPKMLVVNTAEEVVATWGPRPSKATQLVRDYKATHGSIDAEFKKELQVWYNKEKGKNTQEDIVALLNKIL